MLYADYSDDAIRNRLFLGDADALAEAQRRYGDGVRALFRASGVADPDGGLLRTLLEVLSHGSPQRSLWENLRDAAARVARGSAAA